MARFRVRLCALRRRRVVDRQCAQHVRRHAVAGRNLRDGRAVRVSRALSGRRGMARDPLDCAALVAARARGGGGVDARRMGAERGAQWIRLALARLFAAARWRHHAARALRDPGRRVRRVVRRRSLRKRARARGRRVRVVGPAPRRRAAGRRRGARGRRRRAGTRRVDRPGGRAGGRVAAAGQRRAASEVRPGISRRHVRALCRARGAKPRPPDRDAGERVSDVRRRDPGRGAARAAQDRRGTRRRHPDRALHDGAAAAGHAARALLQHRRRAGRLPAAGLPQAPPRPVRRDDPVRSMARPDPRFDPRDSAREPDRGRSRPAAPGRRRPAGGGEHLLRGFLQRRHPAAGTRRDTARQRHQRRLVRPFDRRPAA